MARASRRHLAPIVGLLGLTGCLHLSKDLLPPVEVSPSPFRPFVEYQIAPDFQVATPGGGYIKLATSTKIGRTLMDGALGRWKKKGYIAGFAYINPTRGDFTDDSELRLVLGGSGTLESNAGLQVLSGLTLMVVPAYGEQTFDITVTATRPDLDGRRFQAAAKEGIEEWIQILLLPTMFFAPVVDDAVRARVSDHIYLQLQEQGAFEDPAPDINARKQPSTRFETTDAACSAQMQRLHRNRCPNACGRDIMLGARAPLAYTHHERLTALDASFLDLESPGVHMHVGSVGIFEAGPLLQPDGGIDFDQILALAEASLPRAPRFRQKLGHIPLSGHPIWVDDEHFNLLYHVRHTALPLPGDERRLKRLVGRIMSQKLDRAKPLWELWFVEGLEGDRFAVISKVHHCLIDGISGVDLLAAFMGADPDYRPERIDHRWLSRPRPGPLRLLADEAWRRASLPARVLGGAAKVLRRPERTLEQTSRAASGLAATLGKAFSPASDTPLNVPIGPNRRFDWTRMDLGVVREVKSKLGGTVNDVVLACVAGAVRHQLAAHGVELGGIDFRTLVPVSTRTAQERGKLGNRVSMLVASLPVDEPDPRKRMARVIDETRKLKASGQVQGSEALEEVSDWTVSTLLTTISRLAAARRAFNLVVTNVPGPELPIFLNGARMLASYPLVPLFENQALGVALFGYDGALYWGFNSDWDALPELHDFVLAIEREFEQMRKL